MNSVSRRIQYDHIRLLFDLIKYLKHISGNKSAVGKSISDSIFFCRLDCFFNNLDTDHFLCNRSKHLTDCSCSAEQIEYNLVINISNVFSYSLVQHFCTFRVWLEEGKWCDLKFQSEKLLVKEVLSIKNSCLITLHDIRQGIIQYMKDSNNLSL